MELYFILGIIAMIGYGVTAILYKLASPSIDSVSLTLVVSCFMTFTIFLFWVFYRQKYIAMKGFEYSAIAGVIAGLVLGSMVTLFLYLFPEYRPFGLHEGIVGLTVNCAALVTVSLATQPMDADHVDAFVEASRDTANFG